MKKVFILLLCALGIIAVFAYVKTRPSPPSKIHIHAGFLVYIDGKLKDFSSDNYMNIEFCSVSKTKETPEETQIGKAHLHDHVGDVVHVHRTGAVWGDLFTNMHYAFPSGEPVVGYVNGQAVQNILIYPIRAYDTVIVVVGKNSGVDISKTVPKSHIIEVEKHSESCSG